MNVVAETTELWVENSQKTNCRDVTSIWEGRVCQLDVDFQRYLLTRKNLVRMLYIFIFASVATMPPHFEAFRAI